jgi:hypothetical protein
MGSFFLFFKPFVMTNQQYYDAYVSGVVTMLLQLSDQEVIKVVLEQYANFVLKYDMDRQQADMLDMTILEYHKYIDDMNESL